MNEIKEDEWMNEWMNEYNEGEIKMGGLMKKVTLNISQFMTYSIALFSLWTKQMKSLFPKGPKSTFHSSEKIYIFRKTIIIIALYKLRYM